MYFAAGAAIVRAGVQERLDRLGAGDAVLAVEHEERHPGHPDGAALLEVLVELVAVVAEAGKALDAEDLAIYLVDYEQTLLVPLPDGTDRASLEIDTTLAGRAFAAAFGPAPPTFLAPPPPYFRRASRPRWRERRRRSPPCRAGA